jgi:hypothetical protein
MHTDDRATRQADLRVSLFFNQLRVAKSVGNKMNGMQDHLAENSVEPAKNMTYRSVSKPLRSQSSQPNCGDLAKTAKMPPRA